MASDFLFTSESVSEGHPDKVADQISDAVLDACLAQDPMSRVAAETMCSTGLVVLAGEITTDAQVNYIDLTRDVLKRIGYDNSEYGIDHKGCSVLVGYDQQSEDIKQGVDEKNHDPLTQGAGDQGLMFGFACDETPTLMPAAIYYAHRLVQQQSIVRRNGVMPYLRPDAKSQVTLRYVDGKPVAADTIVLSTQHSPEWSVGDHMKPEFVEAVVENIIRPVMPAEWLKNTRFLVNPTGRFVVGGPQGDCGLTGRKIIVDTYGGRGAHGGGAFSGKDSSKVDRSAAYAARHIAKNLVAAGVADQILVELSYAIGIAQPLSIYVDTYNSPRPAALAGMTDGEIARRIGKLFDLRPAAIVKRFGLKNPIFEATASYGHFGNRPYTKVEKVWENGVETEREIEFFGWEKLDAVEQIKREFGL